MFTRLSRCDYQPLCAVRGCNLAELNPSVYGVVLRGGYCSVYCTLCRQLNKKRTLLLPLASEQRVLTVGLEDILASRDETGDERERSRLASGRLRRCRSTFGVTGDR